MKPSCTGMLVFLPSLPATRDRSPTPSRISRCLSTWKAPKSIRDAAGSRGLGGGVLSIGYASAPHFEAYQFGENTADLAGSLYCLCSRAQLLGCTLEGNIAQAGVGLETTVPTLIDSCTFSGNTASASWGGGILN